MKKKLTLLLSLSFIIFHLSFSPAGAQRLVRQRFHHELPAGNYSGICALGDGRFAVVDDKAEEDGFYVFRIGIDSVKGRITEVANEGYRSSGLPNRDMEGICYCPSTNTLFISGEADNEVYEYHLDGQRTGRRLAMPPEFRKAGKNYGLEALAYDRRRHLFLTTTEQPLPGDTLRIQTFGDDLQPRQQYLYRPDLEIENRKSVNSKFHGVSAMCALDDGRLLVMERQIRVPKMKLGARAVTHIYEVVLPDVPAPDTRHPARPIGTLAEPDGARTPNTYDEPPIVEKHLVKEIRTRLTLTSRRFANCEGLCEPSPGLLLIVADSQNRFRGVLRDWFILLK